ncbi:hypothetical protein HanRHA438_Chr09g0378841 [Helianthus annuus]|uniref:Cysteine-rich transmembrane CYSTM domain-containing protein n=1 Tax=Helianthus annuus TaxID=4232 RepID=A0A251TS71_HELAN|nr:hypothetical protein HanXRQr2_Chr09g0367691 [Helianthus annuus]KAJ0532402.1 hypothetical protein HanIR_Chr09g0396381 [Helianthus annuus]KAJ0886392.1 hypothetical protein HanRHA438_Chr09g0378841 [Helianthus annuus]KAJ0891466.1 hypothetical protein HanPSC8_Chr09g0354101 [Helianthus annuus]
MNPQSDSIKPPVPPSIPTHLQLVIMSCNNESQPPVGAPPQLIMSYNNESQPPVSAPPPPLGYPTNPVPEDAPQQLQQDQQRGVPRQAFGCCVEILCCCLADG